MEVSLNLKRYKNDNGGVNHDMILRVPFEDRLPGLVKKMGLKQVHMTLAAAITLSMESINLTKSLTANQIFDLVDVIIDTSTEDYLSMEDVMLFLQNLVRGEMGELYSTMDIPKFMKAFEKYRQTRHSEYIRLKEEQDAQLKILGKNSTSGIMQRDKNIDPKTFFELYQMANTFDNDTD